MWWESSDKELCPECGGEILKGHLYVRAYDRGSLIPYTGRAKVRWASMDKLTYKQEGLLGKEKEVHKVLKHDLLSSDGGYAESACYCPKCGKVFATFYAGKMDVSL